MSQVGSNHTRNQQADGDLPQSRSDNNQAFVRKIANFGDKSQFHHPWNAGMIKKIWDNSALDVNSNYNNKLALEIHH
ncbi:hypothetical protein [Undibacterium sp.]|uniref:hypothetical protein n=1 Tax=Undibacterium sp. TaxID=1914977 RepID=UPI003750C7D8